MYVIDPCFFLPRPITPRALVVLATNPTQGWQSSDTLRAVWLLLLWLSPLPQSSMMTTTGVTRMVRKRPCCRRRRRSISGVGLQLPLLLLAAALIMVASTTVSAQAQEEEEEEQGGTATAIGNINNINNNNNNNDDGSDDHKNLFDELGTIWLVVIIGALLVLTCLACIGGWYFYYCVYHHHRHKAITNNNSTTSRPSSEQSTRTTSPPKTSSKTRQQQQESAARHHRTIPYGIMVPSPQPPLDDATDHDLTEHNNPLIMDNDSDDLLHADNDNDHDDDDDIEQQSNSMNGVLQQQPRHQQGQPNGPLPRPRSAQRDRLLVRPMRPGYQDNDDKNYDDDDQDVPSNSHSHNNRRNKNTRRLGNHSQKQKQTKKKTTTRTVAAPSPTPLPSSSSSSSATTGVLPAAKAKAAAKAIAQPPAPAAAAAAAATATATTKLRKSGGGSNNNNNNNNNNAKSGAATTAAPLNVGNKMTRTASQSSEIATNGDTFATTSPTTTTTPPVTAKKKTARTPTSNKTATTTTTTGTNATSTTSPTRVARNVTTVKVPPLPSTMATTTSPAATLAKTLEQMKAWTVPPHAQLVYTMVKPRARGQVLVKRKFQLLSRGNGDDATVAASPEYQRIRVLFPDVATATHYGFVVTPMLPTTHLDVSETTTSANMTESESSEHEHCEIVREVPPSMLSTPPSPSMPSRRRSRRTPSRRGGDDKLDHHHHHHHQDSEDKEEDDAQHELSAATRRTIAKVMDTALVPTPQSTRSEKEKPTPPRRHKRSLPPSKRKKTAPPPPPPPKIKEECHRDKEVPSSPTTTSSTKSSSSAVTSPLKNTSLSDPSNQQQHEKPKQRQQQRNGKVRRPKDQGRLVKQKSQTKRSLQQHSVPSPRKRSRYFQQQNLQQQPQQDPEKANTASLLCDMPSIYKSTPTEELRKNQEQEGAPRGQEVEAAVTPPQQELQTNPREVLDMVDSESALHLSDQEEAPASSSAITTPETFEQRSKVPTSPQSLLRSLPSIYTSESSHQLRILQRIHDPPQLEEKHTFSSQPRRKPERRRSLPPMPSEKQEPRPKVKRSLSWPELYGPLQSSPPKQDERKPNTSTHKQLRRKSFPLLRTQEQAVRREIRRDLAFLVHHGEHKNVQARRERKTLSRRLKQPRGGLLKPMPTGPHDPEAKSKIKRNRSSSERSRGRSNSNSKNSIGTMDAQSSFKSHILRPTPLYAHPPSPQTNSYDAFLSKLEREVKYRQFISELEHNMSAQTNEKEFEQLRKRYKRYRKVMKVLEQTVQEQEVKKRIQANSSTCQPPPTPATSSRTVVEMATKKPKGQSKFEEKKECPFNPRPLLADSPGLDIAAPPPAELCVNVSHLVNTPNSPPREVDDSTSATRRTRALNARKSIAEGDSISAHAWRGKKSSSTHFTADNAIIQEAPAFSQAKPLPPPKDIESTIDSTPLTTPLKQLQFDVEKLHSAIPAADSASAQVSAGPKTGEALAERPPSEEDTDQLAATIHDKQADSNAHEKALQMATSKSNADQEFIKRPSLSAEAVLEPVLKSIPDQKHKRATSTSLKSNKTPSPKKERSGKRTATQSTKNRDKSISKAEKKPGISKSTSVQPDKKTKLPKKDRPEKQTAAQTSSIRNIESGSSTQDRQGIPHEASLQPAKKSKSRRKRSHSQQPAVSMPRTRDELQSRSLSPKKTKGRHEVGVLLDDDGQAHTYDEDSLKVEAKKKSNKGKNPRGRLLPLETHPSTRARKRDGKNNEDHHEPPVAVVSFDSSLSSSLDASDDYLFDALEDDLPSSSSPAPVPRPASSSPALVPRPAPEERASSMVEDLRGC